MLKSLCMLGKADNLQREIDEAYSCMFSGLAVSFEEHEDHEDVTLGEINEDGFVTLGKEDPSVH